jgi:hypothetical protein
MPNEEMRMRSKTPPKWISIKAADHHVIEAEDSIDHALTYGGRTIMAPKLACNVEGAIGLPASVFNSAGMQVWTQRERATR